MSAGEWCSRLYEVDDDEKEIVARVEEIARERDSSKRPVDLDVISPSEWELLKVWDSIVEAYERGHQRNIASVAAAVEALLTR